MKPRIIKETPVKTFEEFIEKYKFKEIPRQQFISMDRKRPLRKLGEIKLYGYRSQGGIEGILTTYYFEINTKAFMNVVSAGSLNMIWNDIVRLRKEGKFVTLP